MSKEIKDVNVEEVEGTIEETKEGFGAKVRGFVKRNGKQIALGAAFIGAIGLIYVLGKNSDVVSDEVIDDFTDVIKDEATDVVTDA